jgi:hypothetical protein
MHGETTNAPPLCLCCSKLADSTSVMCSCPILAPSHYAERAQQHSVQHSLHLAGCHITHACMLDLLTAPARQLLLLRGLTSNGPAAPVDAPARVWHVVSKLAPHTVLLRIGTAVVDHDVGHWADACCLERCQQLPQLLLAAIGGVQLVELYW